MKIDDTIEPVEVVNPDVVPNATLPDFFMGSGGQKFMLDPTKLKTQEDVIKVLKHFSSRVELHVFETQGIEEYVKPVSPTTTH